MTLKDTAFSKKDHSIYDLRIQGLQEELAQKNLDGFIITQHEMNENDKESSQYLEKLTGFSGSAGTLIVLARQAIIFIDGRYSLQVLNEINTDILHIKDIGECTPETWLANNLKPKQRLGLDPWLHSINAVSKLKEATKKASAELITITLNPVCSLEPEKPRLVKRTLITHEIRFSGESAEEKIKRVAEEIRKKEAHYLVITDPCSIAWIFNIRAPNMWGTPVLPGFAILPEQGKPLLFMSMDVLSKETEKSLQAFLHLKPEDSFQEALEKIARQKSRIALDPALAPEKLRIIISENEGAIISMEDPVCLFRSIKNPTEREGAKAAHHRDGCALVTFLHWFDSWKPGQMDEIRAAQKLEEYRRKVWQKGDAVFLQPSFKTISAIGKNAALIHYTPSPQTNLVTQEGQVYLIDSGGQYQDGTTDVTRTVATGTPGEEIRHRFTLVLKGLIALSTLRFPSGTRGCDIDALARRELWRNGLDYAHGTGHGVGAFLAVHEGPQKISKTGTQELKEGMILSVEPGYYKEGHYGIRCENLLLVTGAEKIEGGDIPMHGFEALTCVPFDLRLIDLELLTKEEITWLNDYHMHVWKKLNQCLEKETSAWLYKATQKIHDPQNH